MMPGNTLSSTPEPAPFLPPRTTIRYNAQYGKTDVHFGGIALGDASHGIVYQLWTAFIQNGDIWLSAPNTAPILLLPGVQATWVALAFDQSARVQIGYSTAAGAASYYWFDTTIFGYRTSVISGTVPRIFATLDDSRAAEFSQSDVIFAYVRNKTLFTRQERDRFATEYNLGAAPATLVQIGMNLKWRLQFAFQNVQGLNNLPPAEWNTPLGLNEPA